MYAVKLKLFDCSVNVIEHVSTRIGISSGRRGVVLSTTCSKKQLTSAHSASFRIQTKLNPSQASKALWMVLLSMTPYFGKSMIISV